MDSHDRVEVAPVSPCRFVVCPLCRGSGWSPLVRYDAAGEQGDRCPNCAGNGEILTDGGEL